MKIEILFHMDSTQSLLISRMRQDFIQKTWLKENILVKAEYNSCVHSFSMKDYTELTGLDFTFICELLFDNSWIILDIHDL